MEYELSDGCKMELDRGPDWLFVRISKLGNSPRDLAESLCQLLDREFAHRLVLELDNVTSVQSEFVGQLVALHQRVKSNGGLMRICGLSDENQAVLRTSRLASYFPHYRSRQEAVMGDRPRAVH